MTEKRLIFEMSAIDFIEWLNENRYYIAYVGAIIEKECLKCLKND